MHAEPDSPSPRVTSTPPIRQSIITITVSHMPDGSMRGAQLRTAGPLEFMPAVAAQILREVGDQLMPQIARAVTLPDGNGHTP